MIEAPEFNVVLFALLLNFAWANQGTAKKPGTTVSVIDVASMRVSATIETGAGAHGVVVDRDGRHAVVTNTHADTVSAMISLDARSLPRYRSARAPTASAWRLDGGLRRAVRHPRGQQRAV